MSADRAIPTAMQDERAVLGSILMDQALLREVVELLDPDDFYGTAERRTFEAMRALAERGEPIDPNTVESELGSDLEEIGGAGVVGSFLEGIPRGPNVGQYARGVKRASEARRLLRLGQSLLERAHDEDPSELAQSVAGELAVISRNGSRPQAEFEVIDQGYYRLVYKQLGISFAVDRVRRERDQLKGELAVRCDLPGAQTYDGVLNITTFNLSSTRTRKQQASYLKERARTGKGLDWTAMLEEFVQRVLAAEREGQPAVSLRDLEPAEPDDEFVVHGVPLLAHEPIIWFGDGGTLKSYLMLYNLGLLAQRGLRVGFFDWELTGPEHRARLERIFGADMPDVRYARCSRPFVDEVDRLQRIIREDGLDYVGFDSVAFACDGPPEAAEVVSRYQQALRQLGPIGSLHAAHVTKGESSDQKPFGSVFWHNMARSTWNVKLAEVLPDSNKVAVGLYNRKANLGPKVPPVGFEVSFGDDRTRFETVKVEDVADLSSHLSVRQRMIIALRRGPMSPEALAQEIDAETPTVKREARRYKDHFKGLEDGSIALLERNR